MSQLTNIPLQDNYKSTLSQAWDGNTGTIYVNTVPSFTFPSGVKTYICVDPGKTNMQVARISAYDATLKTITVDSITADKGNGVAYTAQTHTVGSVIEISDNYQFREDIQTAINTKVNTNSADTDTGKFADATARDAYFTSPVNGNSAYLTTEGKRTDYVGGAWVDRATGSTPNASTTVAGKVEIATQAEITAGTSTGGTGAILSVSPDTLKVVTDAILVPLYFGSGEDGDVTINSGTTTLTRDMYYNNLTLTSPGVLNPNGYRVFVKGTFSGTGTVSRNGNAGSAGTIGLMGSAGAAGAGGAALNAGSLGMELAGAAGGAGGYAPAVDQVGVAGVAGTATNPSMTNISSVAGGAGGAANAISGGAGGAAAAATRGALYNYVSNPATLHQATATYAALAYKGMPSGGGGGGGGADYTSGTASGGGGGGAGSSGGFIYIWATTWNFTGTVTAVGGAGGAGGAGLNNGPAGGGGGGAGGNGGILFRAYRTLSGDCTKTLTGGAGGAAGAGAAGGSAGTAGTAGTTGETISIVI